MTFVGVAPIEFSVVKCIGLYTILLPSVSVAMLMNLYDDSEITKISKPCISRQEQLKTKKPFQCDKCDHSYVNSHGLRRHNIDQHNVQPFKKSDKYKNKVRNYDCKICGKRYAKKHNLTIHQLGKHLNS